ncbi:MAG TPA: DUF6641 family protein [Magnetospirillum sp.]|nr:DUF6641 family protein [Magnetospirillum sp.]
MSLSDLTLIDAPRPVPHFRATPTEKARQAVLDGIEVQRKLLAAERNGVPPNLVKTVLVADDQGNKTELVVPRKPRRWFFKQTTGQYALEVLYAGQPVVIANGKTAIHAGDHDGVEHALQVVADAVQAGELDSALSAIRAKRKVGRKKPHS